MAHLLAGVDSIWEQEKLEARKLLLNRADSHLSGARFVGRFYFSFNSVLTLSPIFLEINQIPKIINIIPINWSREKGEVN